ncbi:MAG: PilZ domain-containing protein [Hydrogenophilus sp.]|nr:PilZ domain-containing protein [Hydrogenophilus sp.]
MSVRREERRRYRRIPVAGGGLQAHLVTARGEHYEGVCTELSVGGLTLRANYVPALREQMMVQVNQPGGVGGGSIHPLRVRLEVRRCEVVEEGGEFRYEIGGGDRRGSFVRGTAR